MKKKNNFQNFDQEELNVVKRYEHSNRKNYFDVEEFEVIIEFYLDQDRISEAATALQLACKLHPNNQELQIKKAQIYISIGLYDKALNVLDSYSDQNDSELLFWKGTIFAQQEKTEKAVAAFDQFIEQEKNDDLFDELCLDVAHAFKNENVLVYSLKYLSLGYQHNPRNIELVFQYALCCSLLSLENKAIELLNHLLDIHPYNQQAWYQLGEIYFSQNMLSQAKEAIDYAVLLDKEDSFAWKLKGRFLLQTNQYEQSEYCFEKAFDFADSISERTDILLFMGETMERAQNFEKSLSHYTEALKMNNNIGVEDPDVFIGCAYCLLELERYEESLMFSEKVIKKYPHLNEGWFYYAESCLNMNREDDALNAYLKSLEIDDKQSSVYLALGNLYLERHQYKEALSNFLKAYNLEPDLSENVAVFIAATYLYLKDTKKAFQYFDMAMQKSDDAYQLFIQICPEAKKKLDKYLKNGDI